MFPEEACTKAGGMLQLEAGVKAGRIIFSKAGGMALYYFPSREFQRESVLRHRLTGDSSKQGDMTGLDMIQDGYAWDPSNLIAEGLESAGHSMMPMMGAMGSVVPTCNTTLVPPSPMHSWKGDEGALLT